MVEWVTNFIESVGYLGILFLMVLEMIIPVVQSEIVMTFSGFVASRGELSVVAVVIAGIIGSQLGSIGLYYASRWFTEDQVNDWLDRWGGWLGLDRERLERGNDFFRRHDWWAVLIGRFIPGLRGMVAIPAGIHRMRFWSFFGAVLVGTASWITALTALGWVLGDQWRRVDQYSSWITYGFLVTIAAYVAYRLFLVTQEHFRTDSA